MRELGVGFVPYSPLGRGFLTATVDLDSLDAKDFRSRNPRFTGEAGQKNLAIVEAVRKVADAKGVSAAQVALAWVYAQEQRLGVPLADPGHQAVQVARAERRRPRRHPDRRRARLLDPWPPRSPAPATNLGGPPDATPLDPHPPAPASRPPGTLTSSVT